MIISFSRSFYFSLYDTTEYFTHLIILLISSRRKVTELTGRVQRRDATIQRLRSQLASPPTPASTLSPHDGKDSSTVRTLSQAESLTPPPSPLLSPRRPAEEKEEDEGEKTQTYDEAELEAVANALAMKEKTENKAITLFLEEEEKNRKSEERNREGGLTTKGGAAASTAPPAIVQEAVDAKTPTPTTPTPTTSTIITTTAATTAAAALKSAPLVPVTENKESDAAAAVMVVDIQPLAAGEQEQEQEQGAVPAGGSNTDSSPTTTTAATAFDASAWSVNRIVFLLGQPVEARWRGRERWFSATVTAVLKSGSYDLRYDDGDEEASVPRTFVRAAPATKKTVQYRSTNASRAETAPTQANSADAPAPAVAAPVPCAPPLSPGPLPPASAARMATSPVPDSGALQALRDAKAMVDEGLISEDDFQVMKGRILASMR